MTFAIGYFSILLVLFVYSWAFVDLNLHLTDARWFSVVQTPLSSLVYVHMTWAGVVYVALLIGLYTYYLIVLRKRNKDLKTVLPMNVKTFLLSIAVILVFSFPAFTYDIFNYMTTANVLYTHKENPYIVMPIEIPNEPGLAYTRAANKVALYGPTWLLLSFIPHAVGHGNTWITIIAFKAIMSAGYLLMLFLIWKNTRSVKQVLFFGINPLVITEVLVSAHNDIVMMVLAVVAFGSYGLSQENRMDRFAVWLLSVGVKGASIVLFPLLFLRNQKKEKLYIFAFWLLFAVFAVFAPIREELYPWYAIWFLSVASLVPLTKTSFLHGFSVAISMGLSLRHLPYILTREYGGYGPAFRLAFTVIPVFLYIVWYLKTYGVRVLLETGFYVNNSKS